MQTNSNTGRDYLRNLAIVALFSLVIAGVTKQAWSGPYWAHYLIAIGYGVIGTSCGVLFSWRLPESAQLWGRLATILLTTIFGTLHAALWLHYWNAGVNWPSLFKLITLAAVFGTAIVYFFYSREQRLNALNALKELELEKLRAEQALTRSQLQILQSQMEPHFLFNTLANLKALSGADPKQAESMLDRFTELLRQTLKLSRQNAICWEDEITSLSAYLEIQQIRLGSRLNYQLHVDPALDLHAQLPPMLLQPLVENAIYHGIEPVPQGGTVSIAITQQHSRWQFEVSDDGAGLSNANRGGNGLALANLKQRLASLYGDEASFQLLEQAPQGTVARLEIPCAQ